MIVFPLNVINKESKIKLVVMRFEREPFEPIYLKLEINFKKLLKDQFQKTDKFLEVNKGEENKFIASSSQYPDYTEYKLKTERRCL